MSQSIRNRSGGCQAAAGPPSAHFHRNPPGRSQLAEKRKIFNLGGRLRKKTAVLILSELPDCSFRIFFLPCPSYQKWNIVAGSGMPDWVREF